MRRVLLLVLTLTAILAAGGEAQAATCSFTGVGGVGVWHQGSNWSCGHIPTAATSDIAIVDIGDNVTVDQDDSVPTLTQNAGTITFSGSSTLQATTATTLNAGTITGQGTLRAASGTFSKAISGWLTVQNLAKLVLDANASITAGNICLIDNGGGDPQLQINATLTIGAGADADVFNCSTGLDGPAIKIGAAGSLVKSAAGTTTSYTGIDVAGQLSVASAARR